MFPLDIGRDFLPTCWMCNKNEATTGEHIFKHSILRDMYGDKPFEQGDRLIVHAERVYNGKSVSTKKYIQSTDSDKLKFIKSLCETCNGATSQDWDREFDLFLRYLLLNWESSLANGDVNLKIVHCKCTKIDVRNLYNYFCKLFGCLLFTNDRPVPKDIVDIVNGLSYRNVFGVNVVFDVDLEEIFEPREFFVNHDLTGDPSNELNYRWALGFGPIKVGFWYKTPMKFVIGEPWYGKSKSISFVKNV